MQPEDREEIFLKGQDGFPLVVFIHGMGMSASAWTEPAKARVLGGAYSMSALLRGANLEMATTFQDLTALGYSVLTWSQSRPAGPISIAVAELHQLIRRYQGFAGRGVIFLGHSRGGLIARKYLEDSGITAKALITLASPHKGTTMARWAAFLKPLASTLQSLLTGFSRKDTYTAFRRVIAFLQSSGLQELLPESDFYRDLKDQRHEGAYYLSIGGTDPDLLSPLGLPLSAVIARLMPGWIMPDELRDGYGDGLVSAASAVMPCADEHKDFHLSHVALLFDREVREYVTGKVREASQ